MQTVKEVIQILAVVWFGFLIAGEIQKIYYAWQHQKAQTPDNGNECMAFKSNAAGTKMGKAVYCARTNAIDFRNLCLCIGQFGGGLTT